MKVLHFFCLSTNPTTFTRSEANSVLSARLPLTTPIPFLMHGQPTRSLNMDAEWCGERTNVSRDGRLDDVEQFWPASGVRLSMPKLARQQAYQLVKSLSRLPPLLPPYLGKLKWSGRRGDK